MAGVQACVRWNTIGMRSRRALSLGHTVRLASPQRCRRTEGRQFIARVIYNKTVWVKVCSAIFTSLFRGHLARNGRNKREPFTKLPLSIEMTLLWVQA
jgi:hypothetical protein